MHMGIASMVLLHAVRAGGAPRRIQPPRPGHCLCVSLGGFTWLWDGQVKCVAMHSCAHAMRAHCAPHATGLPLCYLWCVSLSQWEWTWMSGWLLGLLCYWKQCAQSARLSACNPHGNHGIAWACSVEDYRALLWLVYLVPLYDTYCCPNQK